MIALGFIPSASNLIKEDDSGSSHRSALGRPLRTSYQGNIPEKQEFTAGLGTVLRIALDRVSVSHDYLWPGLVTARDRTPKGPFPGYSGRKPPVDSLWCVASATLAPNDLIH